MSCYIASRTGQDRKKGLPPIDIEVNSASGRGALNSKPMREFEKLKVALFVSPQTTGLPKSIRTSLDLLSTMSMPSGR